MSTSVELSQLSLDQLQDLSKRLEKELKTKQVLEKKASNREERERRRAVIKQVRELISAHNFKMEELLTPRPKRAARGEGRRAASKSPAKYRNPANPQQTWTGKGRKPGWMLNAIENGVSLEAMIIAVPEEAKEAPAAG